MGSFFFFFKCFFGWLFSSFLVLKGFQGFFSRVSEVFFWGSVWASLFGDEKANLLQSVVFLTGQSLRVGLGLVLGSGFAFITGKGGV